MFLIEEAKEVLKNFQDQIEKVKLVLPNYTKELSFIGERIESLLAKIKQNENGRYDK